MKLLFSCAFLLLGHSSLASVLQEFNSLDDQIIKLLQKPGKETEDALHLMNTYAIDLSHVTIKLDDQRGQKIIGDLTKLLGQGKPKFMDVQLKHDELKAANVESATIAEIEKIQGQMKTIWDEFAAKLDKKTQQPS